MKKFLFLILFFLLLVPTKVFAHIAGQPPFFLMNGKYADFYPVYTTSLPDFTLPQDIAPETYIVGEEIEFKIETNLLPFPPEITDKIEFTWDYGDKTTAKGTINTHNYSKPGTYLLTISADYGGYSDEYTQPVIQAVVLHVKPNTSFLLPKAIITVNGERINDPLTDTLTFPAGTVLNFSAEQSDGGSGEIKSYVWDLGDGKRYTGKNVQKKYSPSQAYVFPFLRVVTKDGFYSDAYVQVENTNDNIFQKPQLSILPIIIFTNIVLLGIGGFYLFRRRS